MTDLNKIQNRIKKNKEILNRYSISKIGIFGSYARNQASKKSDVDLLVEFSKTIDLFAYARLCREMEKLLTRKVDMVTADTLKPLIKNIILKEVKWVEGL